MIFGKHNGKISVTKYSKVIEFLILIKKSDKILLNNNKCSLCAMYALLKRNKKLIHFSNRLFFKKKKKTFSSVKFKAVQ